MKNSLGGIVLVLFGIGIFQSRAGQDLIAVTFGILILLCGLWVLLKPHGIKFPKMTMKLTSVHIIGILGLFGFIIWQQNLIDLGNIQRVMPEEWTRQSSWVMPTVIGLAVLTLICVTIPKGFLRTWIIIGCCIGAIAWHVETNYSVVSTTRVPVRPIGIFERYHTYRMVCGDSTWNLKIAETWLENEKNQAVVFLSSDQQTTIRLRQMGTEKFVGTWEFKDTTGALTHGNIELSERTPDGFSGIMTDSANKYSRRLSLHF